MNLLLYIVIPIKELIFLWSPRINKTRICKIKCRHSYPYKSLIWIIFVTYHPIIDHKRKFTVLMCKIDELFEFATIIEFSILILYN